MSSSERLVLIQKQAKQYVSRAKCRDSSEYTMMLQGRAAKGQVSRPKVANVQDLGDAGGACSATHVVATGKGTNMEQLGLTLGRQGCAICSDPDVGTKLGIALPTPCVNMSKPPFAQHDITVPFYTPPCVASSKEVFFPSFASACDCPENKNIYPS